MAEGGPQQEPVNGIVHLQSPDSEDPITLAKDMYQALGDSPKDISRWPKYLYDARGSELFERITEQPEYYQTDVELSILTEYSPEIISAGDFVELAELGSGSSSKTRELLDALIERKGAANIRYVPLDVSESAVREGMGSLAEDYPGLEALGHVGDFDGFVGEFLRSLTPAKAEGWNRLVIFLGGTIGNFTPTDRAEFMEDVRSGLNAGDRFLLGLDLVKDVATLEAAYDDSAGVTAAFNKNILESINAKIGSDFDPDLFEHRAIYDESESRVEMWLISTQEQDVSLGDPALSVHFEEGEGVRTEISAKFTRRSIEEMFAGSGMRLVRLYTDPRSLFGVALGEPL